MPGEQSDRRFHAANNKKSEGCGRRSGQYGRHEQFALQGVPLLNELLEVQRDIQSATWLPFRTMVREAQPARLLVEDQAIPFSRSWRSSVLWYGSPLVLSASGPDTSANRLPSGRLTKARCSRML